MDYHDGNTDALDKVKSNIGKLTKKKKQLLGSLIGLVNEVCDENDLTYFAMGHLLSYALTGEQVFLSGDEYIIGMLRDDYDKFFRKVSKRAKKNSINVKPFYAGGLANRKNSVLISTGSIKDRTGKSRVVINLRVEPFDELPDDEKERREFIDRMSDEGNSLRNRSYGILRRIKSAARKRRGYGLAYMAGDFVRIAEISAGRRRYHSELCRYRSGRKDADVARIEFIAYPPHNKNEIFPVDKGAFDGAPLMLPHEPERFLSKTGKAREQQVLDAYRATLKKLDRIAAENGIDYFMLGELAVASVNDHDFTEGKLPDVCGVGLLRKDHDRLVSILKEVPGELELMEIYEGYPHVRSEAPWVMDRDYISTNHQDMTPKVMLYPFDSLPDDYLTSCDLIEKVIPEFDRLIDIQTSEKGSAAASGEMTSEDQYRIWEADCRRYNDIEPYSKQIFTVLRKNLKVYLRDEIFPVRRVSFSTFELNAASNEYIDHLREDELYTKHIGDVRTPILKKIDEICLANGITYFAIAELLIGAVIYHDVMPLSDDRPWYLALPRADFERFVAYMEKHGAEHGLQINRFLDDDEVFRSFEVTVTRTGDSLSAAAVTVLPFDRIPEDPYLQLGIISDLREKDRLYKEYVSIRTGRLRERNLKFQDDIPKLKDIDPVRTPEYIDERARLFNDDESASTYGQLAFGISKMINESDIYPLQRIKFRDIEINCPRDYTAWQPMLDDELKRQVKAIQKADLILIKEFDRVCKELGVGYFICGGTMLGYMRHGGFIPWDDDVDCAMLRKDYEYFIHHAGDVLGRDFFLQTRETDETIPYLFSKIRLNNTEYVTDYSDERQYHQGICLDIFPFDYLPNDLMARKEHITEAIRLRDRHNEAARKQFPVPKEERQPRNEMEREYIEKAKQTLKESWDVDLNDTQEDYLRKVTMYNDFAEKDKLTTVACYSPSYTYIDVQDLLPYQRGMFEGVEVSIPRRPDVFLEMQYGDYMKLPPLHDQVAHRLVRWSTWEESSEDRDESKQDRDKDTDDK